MDFGAKLKKLRLQAGLTQDQLAKQVGVSKSVISFYELRERTPSPEVLIKLATIFHVSSDFLLGIEKEKSMDITGLTEEDEQVVRMLVELLRKKNTLKHNWWSYLLKVSLCHNPSRNNLLFKYYRLSWCQALPCLSSEMKPHL